MGLLRPVSHSIWAPASVSNESSSAAHTGLLAVDRNHPVVGTEEVVVPARTVDDVPTLAEIWGPSLHFRDLHVPPRRNSAPSVASRYSPRGPEPPRATSAPTTPVAHAHVTGGTVSPAHHALMNLGRFVEDNSFLSTPLSLLLTPPDNLAPFLALDCLDRELSLA